MHLNSRDRETDKENHHTLLRHALLLCRALQVCKSERLSWPGSCSNMQEKRSSGKSSRVGAKDGGV